MEDKKSTPGQTVPSQTPEQTVPYHTEQTEPRQVQGRQLTLDDIVKLLPTQDASQIVADQVASSLSSGPRLTPEDLLKYLSPGDLHKLLVTVLIQRPVFQPPALGPVAEGAANKYSTVGGALKHD
jgi:hypothetical protein